MPNSVPTLTGLDAPAFLENTVNAMPQILDADVVFGDPDGNFAGGTLIVSGLAAEDIVAIRNQGAGAGQIGFSGGLVTYEGALIGVAAGGAGGTLTVALLAGATSTAVDALIQNLTYATSSDAPPASHALEIKVTDAAGAAAIAPVTFAARTGAANPFNGVDVGSLSAPTFADLDGDGDLDAIIGETNGVLNYFENTGTATAPVFVARTGAANPLGGRDVGTKSKPSFADLDGDGDLDAIVGASDGSLNYFENTGTAGAPAFVARTGVANPFNGKGVFFSSAPSFADLDGDGDLDAVVGDGGGTLSYLENTGTATAPAFVVRTGAANPFNGRDVGGDSAPTFADFDGDGDLDAIVGNDAGILNYFENTGAATAPTYVQRTGAANPFSDLDVGANSAPSFVDLDGDGDLDAVAGELGGILNYVENTTPRAIAPDFVAVTGAGNPFDGVNVGSRSAPSFADLDGDGDLDAVTGEVDGVLNYFRNTGTAIAPVFAAQTGAANPFNGVDVGFESTPSFADIDGDGDLDAVVGEFDGFLNYFENTGTATAPFFVEQIDAANPFNGVDVGSRSAPTFADIDGDGDLDAVVGESDGTLNYFKNTGTATAPTYVQQTGGANPFDGLDVGDLSTPSFADLDGDGDLDLTVGENNGNLNYFRNTGSGFELIVNVTAENDPAVAEDDAFTTAENAVLNGASVFTGAGADSDPDSALTVTAVNGAGASVGTQITLASGALLTLNADGTFDYDPNGAFDHLPAAGSGASNLTATDSFTYVLNGEDTATVTVTITGADSDDRLQGTPGNDLLSGGIGDDEMDGGGGADRLDGGSGADELAGGTGADTLIGGTGDDELDGGTGLDTADYSAAAGGVTVSLATIFAQNTGGAGSDRLFNIERLIGSGSADRLSGDAGANRLQGAGGADILSGGGGADTLLGGAGNDVYYLDHSGDVADETGGDGADEIRSSVSVDLANPSQVVGLIENVRLLGAGAIDAAGDGLTNRLHGNDAGNILTGNGGADILLGGLGDDTMRGGTGNDVYYVDAIGDVVDEAGGSGSDEVRTTVSIDLNQAAQVQGAIEIIRLMNAGAIDATGDNLANTIYGNAGANVLTGNGGADRFVFNTALNAATNVDTIADFSAIQDTMFLENAIFTAFAATGTMSQADYADHIVYDAGTGVLSYDHDGIGGGDAAVQFALLDSSPAITRFDFVVI